MSYMGRALALARESLGTTSPNPSVGALVVREGHVVGEGHTLPPGQAHAEAGALERAGSRAQGATLYTTLEPCCTYGRTPPCTRAIIDSGITEVQMAIYDPNPKVNGKGRDELEAAGVSVKCGDCAKVAVELYEAYAKHVQTGLPFVIAKFAASLDGKIATTSGDSRWITGPDARAYSHDLRRITDAILVGVNTVIADDPRLTARDQDGSPLPRQALRVVVDSQGRLPPGAKLLSEPGHTLVASTKDGWSLAGNQVEVACFPQDGQGRVDLKSILQTLGERGVVSLLVEGGGEVLGVSV